MQKIIRGKKGQKYFTISLCRVDSAIAAGYTPSLNHEHSEWRWIEEEALWKEYDSLHPWVQKLLKHYPKSILEACV